MHQVFSVRELRPTPAPDFSLIFLGCLICRYTALNRSVWQPVESLVYYLLFPVLLFQSIVKSPMDMARRRGLISAGMLSWA